MILHLTAKTSATGFVIFDPAAVAPPAGWGDIEELLASAITDNAQGNLILYSNSRDGPIEISVYVDEQPPDELRLRASNVVRDGFCRFPSGQIQFAGVEELGATEAVLAEPGSVGLLPAGHYRAEGFDVTWEPGHVEKELRSVAGAAAYGFHSFLDAMTGLGCMFALLSVLALVAAGVVGQPVHWSLSLLFVGMIIIPMMLRRAPFERRFESARREVQTRFPPVVLVLTRIEAASELADLQGLAFGIGHVKRHKAKGFEVVFPSQRADP